jgi:SET domain-containing protein
MTNADCKASYKKYDPSKTKLMTRDKRAEVNKKAREITKALKKNQKGVKDNS